MSLTPEHAQKLTDLRSKMMTNVAEGRPAHDGITAEDLAEGLAFLRMNRTAAGEAGGKAKKASKKKPAVEVDTKAFTDMDLD